MYSLFMRVFKHQLEQHSDSYEIWSAIIILDLHYDPKIILLHEHH